LIVSIDVLNAGPSELVVIVPFTTRDRGLSSHIQVDPPEGGLVRPSFALCEAVRSISKTSLARIGKTVGYLIGL